jgi:sugar lactone lactonase YvrE
MSRILLLALSLTLLPGSGLAPSQQAISAQAPFEIWTNGFRHAAGIAVDDDDRVYVSDREAGTVTRLDQNGRRVLVARHLDRPVGLIVDSQGRLLIAEEGGGRVLRLEDGRPTVLAQGIRRPRWLALGNGDTIYVSARRLSRSSDPEPDDDAEPQMIVTLRPTDGAPSVFADGFVKLQDLVVDRGVLYAATSGRRGVRRQEGVVYRIPILPDGRAGLMEAVDPAGALPQPIGLALDRLGALYITSPQVEPGSSQTRHAIVKLQAGDTPVVFASGLGASRGLALDGRGHLYAADGPTGRVLRFLAPPPPALNAPPRFTNQAMIALSGATTPGARVDVLVSPGIPTSPTIAGKTGAFVVSITPPANTDTTVAVHSTPAAGKGLTSPATTATITHDTIAPAAVFLAPPGGAVLRGSTTLRAEAADADSAIAAMGLGAGGRPLETTVAPPPPAASVVASAAWSTVDVPDGLHIVTAAIIDRAGNRTSLGRSVVVDNTPPETEITAGPIGSSPGSSATLAFTGRDNLTPSIALQFAWRLDRGPWTDFEDATTVTLVELIAGDHLFEVAARDHAGNVDPTPAELAFTVRAISPLAIVITEPAAGTAVAPGAIIVRGTVESASDDLGVTVNGLAALVHGPSWAVLVPTFPGVNLLSAVATGRAGTTATTSITVTAPGSEPLLTLRAEPASGMAPLPVTWRITSRTPRPLVRFELDPTGAEGFGSPVSSLGGTQSVLSATGLLFPAVRAIDDQGTAYLARTVVQVDEAQAAADRFGRLWADFTGRLFAGDSAGALDYLTPGLQPRFEPIFQQLGADLPAVASALGGLQLIDSVGHLAEAAIVQVEDGVPFLYFVYFRRDNRGRWVIQEM